MLYKIRIEPLRDISSQEVKRRVKNAFKDIGLSAEGVEILNID